MVLSYLDRKQRSIPLPALQRWFQRKRLFLQTPGCRLLLRRLRRAQRALFFLRDEEQWQPRYTPTAPYEEPEHAHLRVVDGLVIELLGVHGRLDPPAQRKAPGARGVAQDETAGRPVWTDLALVLVVVAVGVLITRPGMLDRLFHGAPSQTAKGEVMVISAKDMDVLAVSQTASARGYGVSIAGIAEDGVARLQSAGKQIAVVIDGDMAGANRVVITANRRHPEARLVILTGARQAGDVSARLLGAGVR